MELNEKQLNEKYINILTTKKVDEILVKQNLGEKILQHDKIWFDNQVGVRKANLQFAMTKKEIQEYSKCKMNIHYFAEQYCKIKREDGSIGPMTLRDYQKKIIDLFTQNNYSILMASRQTGKCVSFTTKVTIKDDDTNKLIDLTLGELYYDLIKMERKLTLIENIKYNLYKLLSIL